MTRYIKKTGPITRIISAVSVFLLLSAYIYSSPEVQDKNSREYLVYMVVWRGVTDAEKGFMDYFKTNKIPAKFIIKDCNNNKNRLPTILSEIKKTKPDLIYTFGTTTTNFIAGKADNYSPDKNIVDIPIIFNIVAKPLESGLVKIDQLNRDIEAAEFSALLKKIDSRTERDFIRKVYVNGTDKNRYALKAGLAKTEKDKLINILSRIDYITISSGRNLTGCSHLVPIEAQMNALKSVTAFSKIGVLYNPSEDNAIKQVNELESYCLNNGITLVRAPFPLDERKNPVITQIPSLIESIKDKKVNIIYLPSDSFIISNASVIMPEINRHRILSFSATEDPIRKNGAMMGLVSHYYNVGLFAGFKAEQILVHHIKAGDIPVDTLKRFSFLVNMGTAKKVNFYPPVMILKFAEIIRNTEKP